LQLPTTLPDVRVDTGVRAGDVVPEHYDSLIAKIVAHGASRGAAIATLQTALAETLVAGIATNRAFLSAILADASFSVCAVDTTFLATHRDSLLDGQKPDR